MNAFSKYISLLIMLYILKVLSYKYRIYPDKLQSEALEKMFNLCRFLYNCALEERISYYKKYKKTLSYSQQTSYLPEIKSLFHEYNEIYSQVLQQVLKQLDSSYKNFFNRIKKSKKPGFPRFKNKFRFHSILFPQCNLTSGGVKRLQNKVSVYGVPEKVKIKFHRDFQGTCKNVRITRSPTNKYYIILSCKYIENIYHENTGNSCGIDLGIESFVTLDDGTSFHHPKPYKTSKEKLAYFQRRKELKRRGSNNRNKIKHTIAKMHEKISNIRDDFQHKLANKLIKENDIIHVEKLNIANMLANKNYQVKNSNITDASWGKFIEKLKYKAERAGILIVEVNPKNTSKMCSHCNNIRENLKLSERTYICDKCGLTMNRDKNSALNIKRAGTALANHKFSETPIL